MPEIKTACLFLRSFRDGDLETFAELAANDDFMRFSGGGGIGREQAAAIFERIMVRTRAGLPAQFAVIDLETKRLLGYCGFFWQTVEEFEELEIAYRFHPIIGDAAWPRKLRERYAITLFAI